MHLLNDLLISLNKANVLVKQSAETVHHCKCWGVDGGKERSGKAGEREREREKRGAEWGEVVAGQWRCLRPINLGLFLPSYCVFLLARD